jgi:hypothetical protein
MLPVVQVREEEIVEVQTGPRGVKTFAFERAFAPVEGQDDVFEEGGWKKRVGVVVVGGEFQGLAKILQALRHARSCSFWPIGRGPTLDLCLCQIMLTTFLDCEAWSKK